MPARRPPEVEEPNGQVVGKCAEWALVGKPVPVIVEKSERRRGRERPSDRFVEAPFDSAAVEARRDQPEARSIQRGRAQRSHSRLPCAASIDSSLDVAESFPDPRQRQRRPDRPGHLGRDGVMSVFHRRKGKQCQRDRGPDPEQAITALDRGAEAAKWLDRSRCSRPNIGQIERATERSVCTDQGQRSPRQRLRQERRHVLPPGFAGKRAGPLGPFRRSVTCMVQSASAPPPCRAIMSSGQARASAMARNQPGRKAQPAQG